jgi:hypothetical protein
MTLIVPPCLYLRVLATLIRTAYCRPSTTCKILSVGMRDELHPDRCVEEKTGSDHINGSMMRLYDEKMMKVLCQGDPWIRL